MLHNNLAVLDKAARVSHAEATHESSKVENTYDTRDPFPPQARKS